MVMYELARQGQCTKNSRRNIKHIAQNKNKQNLLTNYPLRMYL